MKGIPLELAHLGHDLDGMSHERAGPLLKVVTDHSMGGS